MAFMAKILSWRFRHLNIVGCLLKRRPTKGGSQAPQDPPPLPLSYAQVSPSMTLVGSLHYKFSLSGGRDDLLVQVHVNSSSKHACACNMPLNILYFVISK